MKKKIVRTDTRIIIRIIYQEIKNKIIKCQWLFAHYDDDSWMYGDRLMALNYSLDVIQ